MEAAQTKLWRAVRREVSRASRVGPSDSSAASVSSGDDAGLSPEFVAAAHAVNAALARAVADEVEEQLTDVLMCLGEESTKARILEHALTRFDVHVPACSAKRVLPRELAAGFRRRGARRARRRRATRRSPGTERRRRGRRRVPALSRICSLRTRGEVGKEAARRA